MSDTIPFGKAFLVGSELDYIREAAARGHLSGDGEFTRRCSEWFVKELGCHHALLTHSCTAGLELAAIVSGVGPGDEVIMPSFTFVSTANAFVLRGAVPVFVDIRPDNLNLDESLVEAAITPRTRAIVPMHYAGVACDMDRIGAIAKQHGLLVIEDAAQALGATYKGRKLGAIGELGCLSFHDTKNVICGEGGALLFRDATFVERAEIVREKGTNRKAFFRGAVDKYSWVDIGSSYLPGEITAAFLFAQLQQADMLTQRRLALCARYQEGLADLERDGRLTLPKGHPDCRDTGHIFFVLANSAAEREGLRLHLRGLDIHAVTHYVPLHSAVAGLKYGRTPGPMPVTDRVGDTLLRLPLFHELTAAQQDRVIAAVRGFYAKA
ncbi:dTDP-4-amino-4,6-dideoxygalactose transaminase [Betaproteobacteria bacterium GR16-43]|nr:dTDP-4-amino-4,6-dideoxygalactose transaminase [Betaproteobacteria bacterium GR16-43]